VAPVRRGDNCDPIIQSTREMTLTPNVLVVLDPTSKQQPSLERAAWFAQRTGAALDLFICDYEQDFATTAVFDLAALESARRSLIATHFRTLKEHAKRLERQGITARVDARWDHPLDAGILKKAMEAKADLVIKDTHYHDAWRRTLFSSTDWCLIRSCPVPLWLVKPRRMAERPSIVAAVDPLHEHDKPASLDDRILSAAKDICAAAGGELHVFHAYDIAPALAVSADSIMMPISAPVRDVAAALEVRHTEAVFALTDRHSLARSCVEVHEGATRQLLVALTERMKADLVVIGAVSRSALRRLFIGSTAEQVLDKLPCDILIVGPEGLPAAAD